MKPKTHRGERAHSPNAGSDGSSTSSTSNEMPVIADEMQNQIQTHPIGYARTEVLDDESMLILNKSIGILGARCPLQTVDKLVFGHTQSQSANVERKRVGTNAFGFG